MLGFPGAFRLNATVPVEELCGRPFSQVMQAEVLGPLGMTASSFSWQRTAATAYPHDARGRLIPDLAFPEHAAAGLVSTAVDLACFAAAALPGPWGKPPGRGVLSPAGVRLALSPAPATQGRWGLGYGLGVLPSGDRLAYHEGANRGWRAGLALLPDRRAGLVALANGDGGRGRDRRRRPAVGRPGRRAPLARQTPRVGSGRLGHVAAVGSGWRQAGHPPGSRAHGRARASRRPPT